MNTRNRTLLTEYLQALPLFENRYTQLKWLNPPQSNGQKRGNFSLVFSAMDQLDGKKIAIKFFDPTVLSDTYRLESFKREPIILEGLKDKPRCLQLLSPLKKFDFEIKDPSTGTVLAVLPCHFFALEWIENDIDDFFLKQEEFEAIAKLDVFNGILLSVEALHRYEVFHRDLKKDNFRITNCKNKIIKTIDMGTAAGHDVPQMLKQYDSPVGFLPYSAPEAYCGFSGDRVIGKYTDFYALGALLFELFNTEMFHTAHHEKQNFNLVMAAMITDLIVKTSLGDKLRAWKENCRMTKHMISYPKVEEGFSSAPKAITQELNNLINQLTQFDFYDRLADFNIIRQRINSMKNILQYRALEQRELERRKKWREKRIQNIETRERRIAAKNQNMIGR